MVQYVNLLSDTICSPITAPGHSGVSVIRVSGDSAQISTRALAKLPPHLESHKSYFVTLKNTNDESVDQVLITYFAKNRSFTGDETIEISCHGNPVIVNTIINLYLEQGCRSAERGEFSFRAFYNGKIDLVQAESIQQLVTTNNRVGSNTSLKHLAGDLSEIFLILEENLVLAISHLEATIDFVEQDINPSDYNAVKKRLSFVKSEAIKLIDSYDVGKNIKKGYSVLLLGETNVGKSSLFNSLFKEEKAIVTDIAGTTRDLVTGQTFLGNNVVEFIDSAGLRTSSDKIENIGIEKSLNSIQTADLILYTMDSTTGIDGDFIKTLPAGKIFFIFNKIDLVKNREILSQLKLNLDSLLESSIENRVFFISAKDGRGIEELKGDIEKKLAHASDFDGKAIVTQARHFNHLNNIKKHLDESEKLLSLEESPDLISQELSLALMEINQLLGKEYNDEVLDKIFSEFCIGK